MRILSSKASLTVQDAEAVLTEAELLVDNASHQLRRPPSNWTAAYLVMKLSSLFMVLDCVVCTTEVLGDKMNAGRLWGEFAQKFRADYFLPGTGRKLRQRALKRLVNRLSYALSIYKEARRPALQEIIELKGAIITLPYKASQDCRTHCGSSGWRMTRNSRELAMTWDTILTFKRPANEKLKTDLTA
ncbi:LOW QUALITY PROTEIN: uncharacterized protein EMH_0052950 [Eimeria mitis]|uniref:Uncharacterized protein n=1 Tax=Eimeria mitis TaxID=44415 RepID=U6JYJ3_9EIME|nr:LOW QUALITY PROTEIN: uncharacterized protein EMH_0052950 [Eimeria mitis]CDJ29821.1 hypothetical protein EMH_0052950 [Eimeria mitis]